MEYEQNVIFSFFEFSQGYDDRDRKDISMSISMGNGVVIRLAGTPHPETRIFHQEVISIGTAPDCDVVIEAEGLSLPPESVILTLRWKENAFRITTIDAMAGVTRDGEAVRSATRYMTGTRSISARRA